MNEDTAILLVIFSFVLILTWMILGYRRWKYVQKQKEQPGTDNSMGLSELNGIIRKAVAEATEPMAARLESLEAELRRADPPRLMPARRDDLVDAVEETLEEQKAPAERRA